MNWPLLAGSLAGVVVLAGIAWALGLGGGAIADQAEAIRIAEDTLSGFAARDALLADDGRGALVIGRDGTLAFVRQMGAHPVVRPLARPLAISRDGRAAILDSGERGLGRLRFADGDTLLTMV